MNVLIQAVVVTEDRERAAGGLAAALGAVTEQRLPTAPFVFLGTQVFDEWAGKPSTLADIAKAIALLRQ